MSGVLVAGRNESHVLKTLSSLWPDIAGRRVIQVGAVAAVVVCLGCGGSRRDEPVSVSFPGQAIDSPAVPGSVEPNLYTAATGRIYLSWVEPVDGAHSLRFSWRTDTGWSKPTTVAQGRDWFVNWADFPSVIASGDGTLAAHWLRVSGDDPYAYDVNLSQSPDNGKTWSAAVVPHRDGTQTQHGFVSMLPWPDQQVFLVWLDGRNTATTGGHSEDESSEPPMTLRMALVDRGGVVHEETALDERVCSCCQTSAARTTHGAIVVYRDRSPSEIRDISFVRFRDGRWTTPQLVAEDGWQISGCPVNGPSVAAMAQWVGVAWFTHAEERPRVQVAFSNDEGETFGPPIRVDEGDPMGRVDITLLSDGSAVAAWMEYTDDGADIRLRQVWPDGRAGVAHTLAPSSKERASGFPVMASNGREILVAWTDVGKPTQVRVAAIALE
jgi:hypothetical protein